MAEALLRYYTLNETIRNRNRVVMKARTSYPAYIESPNRSKTWPQWASESTAHCELRGRPRTLSYLFCVGISSVPLTDEGVKTLWWDVANGTTFGRKLRHASLRIRMILYSSGAGLKTGQ